MPDLKKLYTPQEATLLYNSNKIRFNPTSYSLKEHLILNKNVEELALETISSYNYQAEQLLLSDINDHESVNTTLASKIATSNLNSTIPQTASSCAAVKEYNLSIALDYLVHECRIDQNSLKNSELMNAIVRMCIALDSVESCCKEMYWFITDLSDVPYKELHNFEPLKKALETNPLELPIAQYHNGIDIIYHETPTPPQSGSIAESSLNESAYYKAYYYILEFLWAYRRLDDTALQRAIAWSIENSGNDTMFGDMCTIANSEIKIYPDIEAMVSISDTADRFTAYQAYMQANDAKVQTWASNAASSCLVYNPIIAMFLAYAESVAVTHVRVNTIAILYTYCKDHGYIRADTQAYINEEFEDREGIGEMLTAAASGQVPDDCKALLDLSPSSVSGGGEANGAVGSSNYNGIFEALDTLNANFDDGKYSYKVKDVRTTDDDVRSAYEKICTKVSLLNRELIRKIKNIKTYNTGGKNPGMSSGRLDRKAMYRYKYDPNIFYNNSYKQLESDLAFGIILDESGSMSGDGITNGKITMIVLHETLKALGINHSIIGHTSRRGDLTCDIERYQSFREDKTYSVCKNYALAGIKAHACNCDSGALYYMERAMDRVRNKDKIVLIFSDGYPTACSGTDLVNQVQAMEKKGIKVIGIGIDFPSISKYYSEYANGRNLKDMLDIVTTILQEYILKKKVD